MIANNLTNGNSSNNSKNSSQSPPVNPNVKTQDSIGDVKRQDIQKTIPLINPPQNGHIIHAMPILNTFQNPNDVQMPQFTIMADPNSVINDQIYLNSQIQFAPNQQMTRVMPQTQQLRDDQNMAALNSNLLFSLQQPTLDQFNAMNNLMTFPTTCMNSLEFMQFINSGISPNNPIQWLNNIPNNLNQLNPQQFLGTHQNDMNDRVRQSQSLMNNDVMKHVKPVFSYSCLIALALKNSGSGALPVNEIYKYMMDNFPYFRSAPEGWKNSVRHNLSLNKAFQKTKSENGNGTQRKGCLWSLKIEKREAMDVEIRKWFKKHPDAIRRSMNNPDNFTHYFRNENQDSNDEHSGHDSKGEIAPFDATNITANLNSGRRDSSLTPEEKKRLAHTNNVSSKSPTAILNTIDSGFLNEIVTEIGSQIVDPWNPHSMGSNFFPNLALINPCSNTDEDPYMYLSNTKAKSRARKHHYEEPN